MKKSITKTVIISTSSFGNPVSDYYNFLADEFIKYNYNVIFIFDGLVNYTHKDSKDKRFLTWPNKRPTKVSDFIFLYKIIKKEQPSICLSNFGSTNVMSIVSFFFKVKNRINYVHTTSTQLSVDSNKHKYRRLLLKYRKRLVYSLNTLLYTNSRGTKQDIIEFYKISEKKIKVVNLLIKQNSISYKKMFERKKSICIVGRLHPSKGHKELLYMFKRSLDEFPELKLYIVGKGYFKNELVELSKVLNISKNVVFKGSVPNNEISHIFSSSLVSISSSIEEAYGLVNVEALREGTPLICTKTAGSLDILLEKINGEYMSHDKEESLLNALRIILNDWEYYSKNALKTFKENFSVEDNIEHQCKRIINDFKH